VPRVRRDSREASRGTSFSNSKYRRSSTRAMKKRAKRGKRRRDRGDPQRRRSVSSSRCPLSLLDARASCSIRGIVSSLDRRGCASYKSVELAQRHAMWSDSWRPAKDAGAPTTPKNSAINRIPRPITRRGLITYAQFAKLRRRV